MLSESCGYTDPSQIKPEDVIIQVQPGRFESLDDLMTVKLPELNAAATETLVNA